MPGHMASRFRHVWLRNDVAGGPGTCPARSAVFIDPRRFPTRGSSDTARDTQRHRVLRKALNIRRRGPYHARHSSVTWQLMLGKNLLWVAKQHGHSVEVMLRMYAAWLDGATAADIQAIKQAMERRPAAGGAIPDVRAAISAVNAGTNRGRLIVIRPPESPEFGSSLAVGKDLNDSSLRNASKIKWRRGWDSNPRAGITRPSDFESAPL